MREGRKQPRPRHPNALAGYATEQEYVPSPYWVDAGHTPNTDIGGVSANVTRAYVAGSTLAEAGVVHTDTATANALFAFVKDGEGVLLRLQ